jgi:hypothetical protein
MKPVAKYQLEEICVVALNRIGRVRKVHTVKIGCPAVGSMSWTLREVEPRFDIHDIRSSYAVIRALQREFALTS